MLNELKLMMDGLKAANIPLESMHEDLHQAGGKEAVRVILERTLKNQVHIKKVEYISKEDLDNIWVIGSNNQDRFPIFKLTVPLRSEGNRLASSIYTFYKSNKSNRENVQSLCHEYDIDSSLIEKDFSLKFLKKLLSIFPTQDPGSEKWPKSRNKQIERFETLKKGKTKNEKALQVIELYRRYSMFGNNGIDFLVELDKALSHRLQQGVAKEFRNLMMNCLFGLTRCNGKGELPGDRRPALVLDYFPSEEHDISVTSSEAYKKVLSDYLISLDELSDRKKSAGPIKVCPITGQSQALLHDKFPDINLGKKLPVSLIKPFSRYEGNLGETVRRYGKVGIASFTIDRDFSRKIDPLLRFLTKPKLRNENATWHRLPSDKKKKNDLLIAYCHDGINIPVSKYYASEIDGKEEYEDNVQELAILIKGESIDLNGLVDMAVFRKLDEANQRIVYTARRKLKDLKSAAEIWVKASKNGPNIGKRKKICIPPNGIVSLSRGYSDMVLSYAQVMRLFFEEGNDYSNLSLRSLRAFFRKTSPLFKKSSEKSGGNCDIRRLVSVFSILLYKYGRFWEDYMTDFSYQLGQLCSAMDDLHLGYCKEVRQESKEPNKLLGSAAYAIALQSPTRALDYLANRLAPYERWVKNKYPGKSSDEWNAVDNAIFAYKWIRRHSPKIYQALQNFHSTQSKNLSQTHGPELMLGYLAGRDIFKKTVDEKEYENE